MKTCAVIIVHLFGCALGICAPGWVSHGLFCYFISDFEAVYTEAERYCSSFNASLVVIEDNDENTFLYSQSAEINRTSFFIGLTQVVPKIWRYMSIGMSPSYVNWDLGEPDGEGDCVRLTPYGSGRWRDQKCSLKHQFICKRYTDCEPPRVKDNSDLLLSKDAISIDNYTALPANSVARYVCYDGYEFADESTELSSTCIYGGEWKPHLNGIPGCTIKKCPPPPVYKDSASNSSGMSYTVGTVVSYTCAPDFWFSQYEANMTKYLQCNSKKQWQGDRIVDCSKKYCVRPVTRNATANSSLNQEGTVASYSCVRGYKFYSDNSTTKVFRCQNEWFPDPQPCLIKRCPKHNVTGATPSTFSTNYGVNVAWRCNPGLRYPDTMTVKYMRCLENEQWDTIVTESCIRKRCLGVPPNTTTAVSNWNPTQIYSFDDAINYTCIDEGSWFPDNKTFRIVRCDADGEWVPKALGECVNYLIEIEVPVHAPKESKQGVAYGTVSLLIIAVLLIGLFVLDGLTIGKHLAKFKSFLGRKDDKSNLL